MPYGEFPGATPLRPVGAGLVPDSRAGCGAASSDFRLPPGRIRSRLSGGGQRGRRPLSARRAGRRRGRKAHKETGSPMAIPRPWIAGTPAQRHAQALAQLANPRAVHADGACVRAHGGRVDINYLPRKLQGAGHCASRPSRTSARAYGVSAGLSSGVAGSLRRPARYATSSRRTSTWVSSLDTRSTSSVFWLSIPVNRFSVLV